MTIRERTGRWILVIVMWALGLYFRNREVYLAADGTLGRISFSDPALGGLQVRFHSWMDPLRTKRTGTLHDLRHHKGAWYFG